MNNTELRCDVAIIGAGTAGLAAARSARRAGAHTLLIDEAFAGTTCANVGCMPSKLLIAAANVAHTCRTAPTFGITASIGIDSAAVMARVRHERDAFAAATRKEIDKIPRDQKIEGRARFVAPTTLSLEDGRRIRARAIVLATGSRPSLPKPFEAVRDLVLTNETIFELPELPRSLAVIGGGPLGLELAQAIARLGTSVALFDSKDTLAAVKDATLDTELQTLLKRDLDLHLGVEIQPSVIDGRVSIRWTGASAGTKVFDRVLIATGRPPDLKHLGLEASGLALDERGTPRFDHETLQCGKSAIFMAGDAAADRPVLHEALAEGAIAGYNAASYPNVKPGQRTVPVSIMFTDPPLAVVGRQSGDDLIRADADYRNQGRAKVEARAAGRVRIYATRKDARLTGATLLCPGADHLAHLLAWSVEAGSDAGTLLDRPFYHPTLEEGLKSALRQLCDEAGVESPFARDQGAPSGA